MRYHWLFTLSLLAAASLAVFATPLVHWNNMRVKHTWDAVPTNWESLGHPPTNTTINLYIALQPHQENALVDALYRVSDPNHQSYGAHLSKEQVAELVKPHPDTLELISSWLVHHGVRSSAISTTHGGAWLTVTDVLVSQANQLLGASYQLYQHTKTNDTIIRTVGYALPAVLHKHIQAVVPTTYFTSPRELRQTPHRRSFGAAATRAEAEASTGEPARVLSSRAGEVYVRTLRSLYKTYGYVPAAAGQNKIGVVGLQKHYPSQMDLTMFMNIFRSDARAATYTVERVNGGEYDPNGEPGEEANTDVQYASAMVYPTPLIFYSIGGGGTWGTDNQPLAGDAYLEWFHHLLAQPEIPQTISISYGTNENKFPQQYAVAICDLFLQLGARGVSVLFSTGDGGVGAGDCKDTSGNVRFTPEFPATCPYITSVGGTTGNPDEVAAFISGGGFSDHFPRPPYQNEAVPEYLNKIGSQHAGLYNPDGRGIPDISAQALRLVIMYGNAALFMDGTSCSTPVVAGIISLLNDYRISKGRPPLGFLNPRLYGSGLAGLNDITSGSNPGCGTDGFPAVVGWDPVTGLGTPNFVKLQNIVVPPAGSPPSGPSQGNQPDILGAA
ncbi:subtilisin-like protein [Lactarius psammicola]|nr:subtilisin-like protein [Lactarius psammicola]